ncbi:2-keto-4-pentenoate hydratase [Bacillus sp. AFS001701]|uniref:2-keto-4-pentenoate hydratase n=1 Tax=Bacillaceae TaxID=186817 RepID=UPI000BF78717|nr:fumarylacetoacetate hydrolase family protein [Bacillus sp. AFS001701]PET54581.1 2-keto-4-pentenoate hydratase [Bacillus sp. AFS001701]
MKITSVDELTILLQEAEESGVSIKALTEIFPGLTEREAYQIQLTNVEEKLKKGQKIIGKKIGLTSIAMQELLGVDEPDYGHLLTDMNIPNFGEVQVANMILPKVEAEIAFVLKKDLIGPNITFEDVVNATDYIVPALEVVDSRIENWKIRLEDTVADNASSCLFVLGNERFDVKDIDLPNVTMELYRNEELMNSGKGEAVLGNPIHCVAWLANKLSEFGISLNAGEIILSGALSAAINANAGDLFTAKFPLLGDVSISFK